jgi:polysaccharide biosynthesis protein PslG
LSTRRSPLTLISVALTGILVVIAFGSLSDQAQARRADGWVRVYPKSHAHANQAKGARAESKTQNADSSRSAGVALGGAIQNESSFALAQDFDAIGSTGARWVRMDINWDLIQRDGASSYNWAPFDRVVSAAQARGLNVLATILYTPPWARPAGTGASTPPTRLSDYVSFAKAAAGRYAPLGVHAYEIWNEPNNTRFWAPRADAGRYTEMLKGASTAIRSVDAQAFIVTAGTSPALDEGGNIAPVTFLKQIYARGGKDAFDAVGHHPYCTPGSPGESQWWNPWYQMTGAPTSLRTVMAANGDAGKQIWATEFGAPTGGPSGSFVPEAAQAELVTRAYRLFGSYRWAGPLFWYAARDLGTDRRTREDFYGLLRNDFSPKPAFDAYRAVTAAG